MSIFPSVRVSICLSREYYRGKYHCTVDLLFDWFGLVCFANKNKKKFSCLTADSKPVKQEVNGTVILPPLVFPDHKLDRIEQIIIIIFQ